MTMNRRNCLLGLAGTALAQGPRAGFDALIGGWSRIDGNHHIVVRAVGAYDGSNYELRLDAASDRLVGSHYQAAAKQNSEVAFMRR